METRRGFLQRVAATAATLLSANESIAQIKTSGEDEVSRKKLDKLAIEINLKREKYKNNQSFIEAESIHRFATNLSKKMPEIISKLDQQLPNDKVATETFNKVLNKMRNDIKDNILKVESLLGDLK
jgi:uncharacterized protein YifN (PemK superfamily)